jgi:hypothetical protein
MHTTTCRNAGTRCSKWYQQHKSCGIELSRCVRGIGLLAPAAEEDSCCCASRASAGRQAGMLLRNPTEPGQQQGHNIVGGQSLESSKQVADWIVQKHLHVGGM